MLGKKIEMSQIFDKQGNVIPVTLIEAGPCFITQIKTKEPRSIANNGLRGKQDGYDAVQLGFERLKEKKIKKPQKKKPYRYLKEFKTDVSKYKIGDKVDVSVFKEGDEVKISGVSKGKGFSGAVKRWGFHGRGASHGVKHEQRTLGSTGRRFPQRTTKGKKMPGRAGSERITIKNLKIVKIDLEKNLLAVKGAVPGRRGTLLEIRG